jgi:hypothetical protein
VKIVMTLVVRDEAEIISDQLDYHLAAGVDFVLATDHRSEDGTREILERYEQRGVLRLFREDGEFIRQGQWQTRMARLAATEHGADWVVNSDADEFWWPLGASLAESLSLVPHEFGVVCAFMQNFVPVRDDQGWFVERMTYRFAPVASLNDPATPYRPAVKVVHRADPAAVTAAGGGHRVTGVRGALLTSWYPLDILHFPIRTGEQCERKYRRTWTGWETNLRESVVARGLEQGALVEDTRLRDALRAIRGGEPVMTGGSAGIGHVRPGAHDRMLFEEAELVRASRRMGDLEARLARLESTRLGARA